MVSEALQRRVLPRVVVGLSQVDAPARVGAWVRRGLGRRGRVELFFAFDDPSSAVALLGLVESMASRDVSLVLKPVVGRGIPGDPAVEQKRDYAITDSRRRARRLMGLELARADPLTAGATAFLAEWAAAAPQDATALTSFCSEAMKRLWFETDGLVKEAEYERLWRERFGGEPPAGGSAAVQRNERLMRRRKPYDVPAAYVHGRWFFAHDRLPQIGRRLDRLGWTAA
jgi:2-hydroxychromene-2-carboxylate isomerase